MPLAAQVYHMLGNESLWDVAVHCHSALHRSQIPHSICGGVAVCLHGYQRNTTDLDMIIEARDAARVSELLSSNGYEWDAQAKEFRSKSGVAIQFLIAGEKAGKDSAVKVPEPSGPFNVEEREGLTVVKLSRLIEMKIACGSGSLRRTHKDFADVVELILVRQLDLAFAQYLHPSLRATYKQLFRSAHAED